MHKLKAKIFIVLILVVSLVSLNYKNRIVGEGIAKEIIDLTLS